MKLMQWATAPMVAMISAILSITAEIAKMGRRLAHNARAKGSDMLKLILTREHAGIGQIVDDDGTVVAFVTDEGTICNQDGGREAVAIVVEECGICYVTPSRYAPPRAEAIDSTTPGEQRSIDSDEGVNQEVQGQ